LAAIGGQRLDALDQLRFPTVERRDNRMGAPRRAQSVGGRETSKSVLIQPFDKNGDAFPTGKARAPRDLVRDAKLQQTRDAIVDNIERRSDHITFNATRGDRTDEPSGVVDDEMRAKRARRRAESFNHGRNGDARASVAPILRLSQDFGFVGQYCYPCLSAGNNNIIFVGKRSTLGDFL